MTNKIISQFGDKSIYIEKNEGTIYVGEYVANTSHAFEDGSFDLHKYSPSIQPPLKRLEVNSILDWIEEDTPVGKSNHLALVYGRAGIGKSVVMHDLLESLNNKENYLVLGLKSDQIEFVNTDDLAKQMHLAKPIVTVIKEMSQSVRRVVLLIDQIDALSLSLSSNRTPLRSILKLIDQVRNIEHVRVVISCRPYDLEYDPILHNLEIDTKWELKEFPKEQVKQSLSDNEYKNSISDDLLHFLGNPLHLFLFIKVMPHAQLTDPVTEEILYNELWRIYICDVDQNQINKKALLELLDNMVNTMYDRQELSVHIGNYETTYNSELKYLFSNGLLILTQNGQMQFFHQTMFDYVYARRFAEHDRNLMEELKEQHQGLFSRAAIKSILTFQRDINTPAYKENIEKMLFDKGKDGKDIYRYHLKSLVLSNMVYFEFPKKEELDLICRKIYDNEQYMGILFESIHNKNWFDKIWIIIESKGGWNSLKISYKEKVMTMCRRTLHSNTNKILDLANQILDYGNSDDRSLVERLLSFYKLNCSSEKLISIYEKMVVSRHPLEYTSILRNIVKESPEYVCNELKENIKIQLAAKERPNFHTINFNHNEEEIFEELQKLHPDSAISLYIDLLSMIMEATKFEISGSEILNSFEFSHFRRARGGHFMNDFTIDIANKLIDYFIKYIDQDSVKSEIEKLAYSNYDGFVFIALYVYSERTDMFVNEAYQLIIKREVLSNAPCWVEYQAVELLEKTFMLMTRKQKDLVISKILKQTDEGEKIVYDKNFVKNHLQFSLPITWIGHHRGQILHILPLQELHDHYWEAYQERLRMERKFPHLENEQPFKTSSTSGWASVGKDIATKMSLKAWYKSMKKYVTDDHFDWKKPSLTGQATLFRESVKESPDKFITLLDNIIANDNIPIAYAEAGMRGFLDAKRLDEAEHVFSSIVSLLNNDVNSTVRGFNIHSFLYAIDDFIKGEKLSPSILNFICKTVREVEEEPVNEENISQDIYNKGINQARGHAGYMLVQCAYFEDFKNNIFDTLEFIAETASIYTRSAILQNMAILNIIDKDRNVSLFKKLLHDYNPSLMSMPVHNHNPLVYFVNYAVEEIIDFFRQASDCPECYKEQVIILWLAWSHNNHHVESRKLLNKMCDNSEEARLALLQFLYRLENKLNQDAIDYICYFMQPQFYSLSMSDQCDNIFHNMDTWSIKTQKLIAQTFVDSPVSGHKLHSFLEFLAGYAITDPLQSLLWLKKVLSRRKLKDYDAWYQITDVLLQSYNGIKAFNDHENKYVLEDAMDLMDLLMQSPENKDLMSNPINKLDND